MGKQDEGGGEEVMKRKRKKKDGEGVEEKERWDRKMEGG